jgi:hypothetical protein
MACGIALMVDSYAITSTGWLIAINIAIVLAPLVRKKY